MKMLLNQFDDYVNNNSTIMNNLLWVAIIDTIYIIGNISKLMSRCLKFLSSIIFDQSIIPYVISST